MTVTKTPFPGDLEIILHAGAYKTATSTIQTLMACNRDALVQRYGLLYPRSGTRRNSGSANQHSVAHHMFYHAVRTDGRGPNPDAMAALRNKLSEEVAESGVKRVVLCSELFASSSRQAKVAFLSILAPARLRVVYTIRRPDDYTDSVINQRFKDLRAPDIATDRPLPTLRHVTEWEELLGEGSVRLLPFSKQDYPTYLRRIFAALGTRQDDPLIDPNLHDNPAMSLSGFLMRRTITARLAAKSVPIDRNLRHRLNVELDQLETFMPKSAKAVFLTPKLRRNIMELNAPQVEALARRMSPQEAETFLGEISPPVSQAPRNVDADPTMSAETLAAICEGFTSGYLGKILAY